MLTNNSPSLSPCLCWITDVPLAPSPPPCLSENPPPPLFSIQTPRPATSQTPPPFPLQKAFNRSLVRTGVWRGFWNRPQNLKTTERGREYWKRALLFSAPNPKNIWPLPPKQKKKLTRPPGIVTRTPIIGGVPKAPDPNTSAKVSRCKWEAYRNINWWCQD